MLKVGATLSSASCCGTVLPLRLLVQPSSPRRLGAGALIAHGLAHVRPR